MLEKVILILGSVASIIQIFQFIGHNINESHSKEISRWLRETKPSSILTAYPSVFISLFDRVFDSRHISRRRILHSCIASLTSVVFLALLVTMISEDTWINFRDDFSSLPQSLLAFTIVTLILNIIPDYISLVETRILIGYMSKVRLRFYPLIVILDLTFTASIFILWAHMLANFIPSDIDVFGVLGESILSWRGGSEYSIVSVWFFSTFSTSFWILLFFLSAITLRILLFFDAGFDFFSRFFEIEKSPMRSIGVVCGVIVLTTLIVVLF